MNLDQWIVFYANQIGGLATWIDPVVVFFAQYFPYVVVLSFAVFVALVSQKENTPRTPLPVGDGAVYDYSRTPLARGDRENKRGGGRVRLIAEGIGAALIARGFVEVFRFFMHRPRPFVAEPAIISLLNETSYSFPSGHATFFFALSTVVYVYNKRWGVWFFIASTVIGFARIMAGVHYLTDIIGGAVLGIVVGFAVQRFWRRKSSDQP